MPSLSLTRTYLRRTVFILGFMCFVVTLTLFREISDISLDSSSTWPNDESIVKLEKRSNNISRTIRAAEDSAVNVQAVSPVEGTIKNRSREYSDGWREVEVLVKHRNHLQQQVKQMRLQIDELIQQLTRRNGIYFLEIDCGGSEAFIRNSCQTVATPPWHHIGSRANCTELGTGAKCKSIIKKSALPSPGDHSMTGPAFTWQSYGDSFQPRLSSAEIIHGIPANNEQEVIPFARFTLNRIYLVEPGLEKRVVEKPIGHKRRAIDGVLKAALESLNRERDGLLRYTTMEFLEGIYRTVPGMCEYYELYFRDLESTQYRKLTLIQAFSPPTIVSTSVARVRHEVIHLIIPLSGRIGKFQKFVGRLVQIYSSSDNLIHVTVVYFGIPGLEKIRSIVSNVKSKYNFAHINVLPIEGNFSRGVALQAGADSLKSPDKDVLMFFCDVDIVFTTDFLERCRLNTEAGKRVYYPILFSLYNPQMVYTLQGQNIPDDVDQLVISSDSGFWRDFGYGMTCQYLSDFRKMGGFSGDIVGWGMEDVLLYRRYVQSNLLVLRATDPGIFHLWHRKHCDPGLPQDQYRGCIRSKALTEASHTQLGILAFRNEMIQYINITHKQSKFLDSSIL